MQHLLTGPMSSATEVVTDLLCVQAQEWGHAMWSLGCRTRDATFTSVRAELDAGRFLRTHILRPTWHFVAAADIRLVLAVTSPRVQRRNAGRYRELGLDAATRARSVEVMRGVLSGGRSLQRRELGEALQRGGIPATGQRLAYAVMNAELEGVVCSGPLVAGQHTYALLDERVPAEARPEDALAELVFRFFSGHGPASVADLVRWSSLSAAQVRDGLEVASDRLRSGPVGKETLWWDPRRPDPELPPGPRVLLLPLYDELVLSYRSSKLPVAEGHPHPPGQRQFLGPVVIDEVDVGTWRRTVRGTTVTVETRLAPGPGDRELAALETQRRRLADFLGVDLVPG